VTKHSDQDRTVPTMKNYHATERNVETMTVKPTAINVVNRAGETELEPLPPVVVVGAVVVVDPVNAVVVVVLPTSPVVLSPHETESVARTTDRKSTSFIAEFIIVFV